MPPYLRRPPPRPPPPPPRPPPPPPPKLRPPPILEAPRERLSLAPEPLIPLPAPPNALLFRALGVLGTERLPTRSPPPPPKPPLPRPPPPVPGRFIEPAWRFAPRSMVPAVPRFIEAFCRRAFACRFAMDSPLVVPPNLPAVARSEYGAPPRCRGLCCQLP